MYDTVLLTIGIVVQQISRTYLSCITATSHPPSSKSPFPHPAIPTLYLKTSLFSSTTWCSRLILCDPCSPWFRHFFKEHWFPYLHMVFRNEEVGASCAHCCWVKDGSRPSQWTELGNLYRYWHRSIHICIYMFVYIDTHMLGQNQRYPVNSVYTDTFASNQHHKVHSDLSLFLNCNSFLQW